MVTASLSTPVPSINELLRQDIYTQVASSSANAQWMQNCNRPVSPAEATVAIGDSKATINGDPRPSRRIPQHPTVLNIDVHTEAMTVPDQRRAQESRIWRSQHSAITSPLSCTPEAGLEN